jgi:hypothetical protein
MYLEVDRHTTVSDILEGFGTASHLMPAYDPWRRTKNRKAEAKFNATTPHIKQVIDTTRTCISVHPKELIYDS